MVSDRKMSGIENKLVKMMSSSIRTLSRVITCGPISAFHASLVGYFVVVVVFSAEVWTRVA